VHLLFLGNRVSVPSAGLVRQRVVRLEDNVLLSAIDVVLAEPFSLFLLTDTVHERVEQRLVGKFVTASFLEVGEKFLLQLGRPIIVVFVLFVSEHVRT